MIEAKGQVLQMTTLCSLLVNFLHDQQIVSASLLLLVITVNNNYLPKKKRRGTTIRDVILIHDNTSSQTSTLTNWEK